MSHLFPFLAGLREWMRAISRAKAEKGATDQRVFQVSDSVPVHVRLAMVGRGIELPRLEVPGLRVTCRAQRQGRRML